MGSMRWGSVATCVWMLALGCSSSEGAPSPSSGGANAASGGSSGAASGGRPAAGGAASNSGGTASNSGGTTGSSGTGGNTASGGTSGTGGASGGSGGSSTGGAGGAAGACQWAHLDWTKCPACTDAATCDDASYRPLGDGTVASSCCGLVWQAEAGPSMSRDAAGEYCKNLTLAGAAWRLPTVAELASLVRRGLEQPTIDRAAFPGTPPEFFWSSDVVPNLSIVSPFVVDFYFGSTPGTSDPSRVRCVHAGGPAVTHQPSGACLRTKPGVCPILPACADMTGCDHPIFTARSDGTVASSCCGLTWEQGYEERVRWSAAPTRCETLTLAGGGWRLPRQAELATLLVLGQTPVSPALDRAAFPDDAVSEPQYRGSYWSSSPDDGSLSREVWITDFRTGEVRSSSLSLATLSSVRCVR
jgi:hypothetical protein